MLPWAEWWLGDSPEALLPDTQIQGLRPCFVSGFLKSRRKTLSVVIELGHPHKPCGLCCKHRGKSELFAECSPGCWDGCVWGHNVPCGCRWMPVCWSLVMALDQCSPGTDPHHPLGPEAMAISKLTGHRWTLHSCCSSWSRVLWAAVGTGGLPGALPSLAIQWCHGRGTEGSCQPQKGQLWYLCTSRQCVFKQGKCLSCST